MDIRAESLLLPQEGSSRSTVRAETGQLPPDPTSDIRESYWFFVGELTTDPDIARKLFDIFLEVFERGFDQPKTQQPKSIPALFEKAVSHVNQALSSLAAEGYVQWVDTLHAVLGVITPDDIHVTRTGAMRGFLIRDEQLIDIIRDRPVKTDQPIKTFQSVISGSLTQGDTLLFSSPQLTELLSQEKLRRLLVQSPISSVREALITLLDTQDTDACLALQMFARERVPEPVEERIAVSATTATPVTIPQPVVAPAQRLSNHSTRLHSFSPSQILQRAQKRTAPSRTPTSPTQEPHTPLSAESSVAHTPTSSHTTTTTSDTPTVRTTSLYTSAVSTLANSKSKFAHWRAMRAPQRISSDTSIHPRPSFRTQLSELPSTILHMFRSFGSRFLRLQRKSQFLFLGSFLLLLIVGTSIGRSILESRQTTTLSEQSTAVFLVEEQIRSASDMLLYQDEAGARSTLSEAEALLASGVADGTITEEESTTLITTISEIRDRVDHITRLSDITPIVPISNQTPIGMIELDSERIFFTDTDIYGETDARTLSQRASLPEESEGVIVDAFQDSSGGEAVFLLSDRSFVYFNPATNGITTATGSPASGSSITGGGLYNGNVYLLDVGTNQITKHSDTGSGYGAAQSWISTPGESLETATDLSIDGSIYVLFSNGTVKNYLSGALQEFSVEQPSDPFVNASFIEVDADGNRLLILDPATERLAVYDKGSGRLISQYIGAPLGEAIDLFTNTAGTKASVLTPDGIYELSL